MSGRFARGAVWSLAGAALAQGGNLAASVVTGRLLGREQFGAFGVVQGTVGMLGVFAGLGLGVTATKYVAEFRTRHPQRAGRIIALGCAMAVVSGGVLALALIAFAPLLASRTLNAPALAAELRIAGLVLFFNALNGAQNGALAGFEAFRLIARINLWRGLAGFPIAAAGVLLGGLPGAVWALAATSALTCALTQIALRRHCRELGIGPSLRSGWAERRVVWTFSAPALLGSALVGPAIWAASAFLVNQPGGYAEMGLYSAASQWRTAIAFVPGVLAQLALPILSNLNGERDSARYFRALRWNLGLTAAAATAVALPVAFAAPYIMRLYGRGFQQGALVLVLSAVTAVIVCLNNVVGTAILSAGSVWVGFAFNALWAAALIAGSFFLIGPHRAVGLAAAMLGAYLAHTVWQAVYLRCHLSHSQS